MIIDQETDKSIRMLVRHPQFKDFISLLEKVYTDALRDSCKENELTNICRAQGKAIIIDLILKEIAKRKER